MFGIRRNRVVGVDIGSAATKIVQLRKDADSWMVAAAGIARTTRRTGRDRMQGAVRVIQNSLELSGSTARLAVCGVGGQEAAIRDFELGSAGPSFVEEAVQAEAKHLSPFDTDDIRFDYKVISNSNGKVRGYIAAVTSSRLKSKLDLVKKSGLKCVLVDIEALALLNCYNELEKPEEDSCTAIVNIGSSCTTFAIEDKDRRPFVREIRFGGCDIISTIAVANEISEDSVEQSLFNPDHTAGEFAHSFSAACSRLVTEINRTVRSYEAQGSALTVRKLLVCGGFAPANGLLDLLNEQLPIEVVLWNPLEKMSLSVTRNHNKVLRHNVIRNCGPAMAVAAGLAMRSI